VSLTACGGDGSSSGSGTPSRQDGCEVVTASDAEGILGDPVEKHEGIGPGNPSHPSVVMECIWDVTTARVAQLQFRVRQGEEWYVEPSAPSEPFDVGDPSYIRVDSGMEVIDIGFVLQSKSVELFAVGAGPTKRSEMESLARKVAGVLTP
jgi:hypothetical protein